MDIDTFAELADEMIEEMPEALFVELNGGILVDEEARRNDDDPPDVYILGEYVTDDVLGAQIVLYYGSFVALFGDDDETVEEELWITIVHELRHHVEGRAGLNDLDREDLEELQAFWREVDEAEGRGADDDPLDGRRRDPGDGPPPKGRGR